MTIGRKNTFSLGLVIHRHYPWWIVLCALSLRWVDGLLADKRGQYIYFHKWTKQILRQILKSLGACGCLATGPFVRLKLHDVIMCKGVDTALQNDFNEGHHGYEHWDNDPRIWSGQLGVGVLRLQTNFLWTEFHLILWLWKYHLSAKYQIIFDNNHSSTAEAKVPWGESTKPISFIHKFLCFSELSHLFSS